MSTLSSFFARFLAQSDAKFTRTILVSPFRHFIEMAVSTATFMNLLGKNASLLRNAV